MSSLGRRLPRPTVLRLLVGSVTVVVALCYAILTGRAPELEATPSPDAVARFLPPAVDPVPWVDVQWQRAADPDRTLGGPLIQRIDRIAQGGPGFIAIGAEARGEESAQTQFGAVWLSTTGHTWQELELVAGNRPGDGASPQHVVDGPSGIVIAGSVCCEEEGPAIWWSPDGARWERRPLPANVGRDAYIRSVAAGPEGYVAVGSAGGQGAIWTSVDGRNWTGVDARVADLPPGSINGVARSSDGWIAVGQIDGRATSDGGVWFSAALVGWRRLGDAPGLAGNDEVELYRVLPFGGGILAVGGQGTHEDRLACEQMGHDSRIASTDPDLLALSCGWIFETHWLSLDGLEWERLPDLFPRKPQPLPDPIPPHRLISWQTMAAGGPGLVVVDPELIGRTDSSNSSAMWTSADGRTWVRTGNGPHLPPNEQPVGLAVIGRTVLAVGERQGGDGSVWIGTVQP